MTNTLLLILFGLLAAVGFSKLAKWGSWCKKNPQAADMLFFDKGRMEAFIFVMLRDPPDKHSDMWKE